MDGGGRRQLPSWMMRTTAAEQDNLEIKGENKENCAVEPHTKAVEPQRKARAKNHDIEVPLIDNKLRLLKNCEARTRKRKSNTHEKSQGERSQEDESGFLQPCKEIRNKRVPAMQGKDQIDVFPESDREKKVDGLVRKRVRDNVPKKQSKKFKEFHNGIAEPCSSEDELTVEDLVSIAEEYVEANRKEFQKSKELELELESKSLHRADSQISSEKQLPSYRENSLVTGQPLSSDSSVTKPVSSEGSNINLISTGDISRDMLNLLMGHWLKKSEEVERKTDAMTQEITLDLSSAKEVKMRM